MALADTLTAVGTAALTRSGALPLGAHLFPVQPGEGLAATVLPVRCAPGDNLALHVAVAQAAPGSALVVDASADPEFGYVDEILAVAARMRGLAGIVVDGCVRDLGAIARTGLPVVSAGVSPRGTAHEAGGAVGREITMNTGGAPVAVRRGDWVAVDDDGVVCLPRGRAADIVADALRAATTDRELVEAVCAGESTIELLDLDPTRVAGWEGGPGRFEAAPAAER
ncbi:RraA family protein [Nocardiopsis suaedae]|uniref:Putative 4-hydroxy-4-methyl-2-oxoglutarate aldolase n=1 Tax=Nocardiopsis suaedae TaxID=3018444 RepID=A0ABT4TSY6_9ACTN|nr:RraA family protein [Nocardiopsis suaedae]MDA2807810.1 RraA family protein [Nocardiopsis suaedae]